MGWPGEQVEGQARVLPAPVAPLGVALLVARLLTEHWVGKLCLLCLAFSYFPKFVPITDK